MVSPRVCHITIRDEVFCYITGLAPTDNDFLWQKYGIFKDGYFWSPKYKLGSWDGKIRFYEKTGKTYLRLLDEIIPFIVDSGYEVVLSDKRSTLVPDIPRIDEEWFARKGCTFKGEPVMIRPYQVEAINELAAHQDGFVIAGTGAGKSLMCAGLCDLFTETELRTITIVPSSDLITQTQEWYEICHLDVGVYSGSIKDIHHKHVVATWESIQNNLKLMHDFDVFIWDEAHGAAAAVAGKIIKDYAKHMAFRFGCTGTFPKPQVDQLTLNTAIGPIRKVITARWLIDNGYLAKLLIEPIEIHETYIEEEFPDYAAERAFITKSEKRLDIIADLIIDHAEVYGNTFVLVSNIKFGEKLQSRIKDSVFMYGGTDNAERKEHYNEYDDSDGLIKIATFGIAKQGISIDRIYCLFMIDTGKSFITTIQSIGRSLRLAKDKDSVHVVDIHSSLKWSRKHFRERIKWFRENEYAYEKTKKIKLK